MRRKEKTEIRVDIATRAAIAALEKFKERNPGQCIKKSELFPSAARRAGWIIDDADDEVYFLEAITAPTEKFFSRKWSDICLQAAKEYRKYIVWDHGAGIRLGTLEEYQDILNNVIRAIGVGIVDNGTARAKIIGKHGGQPILMDIQFKLLKSGDGDDDKLNGDLPR